MGKRNRFRDDWDPEMRRWGQKYPRFPGVAECARLIRDGKAQGGRAEIIVYELAENAANCLPDLIETFRTDPNETVRQFIMMALEIARLPESVPFLAEVLQQGDEHYAPYAFRTLKAIDTRESRTALWRAAQNKSGPVS